MNSSLSAWPAPTPAVTLPPPPDEPYPDFQRRVAANIVRAAEKCAALDPYIPRCKACGETGAAGDRCRENGIPLMSRWAENVAAVEFYMLGNFALRGWSTSEHALAVLLDRVRAGLHDLQPTYGARP